MLRTARGLGALLLVDEGVNQERPYVLERVRVMAGVISRFEARARTNRDALASVLRSRITRLRADFDALPNMNTAAFNYIWYEAGAALNAISRTYNELERLVDTAIARAGTSLPEPAPPPPPPSPPGPEPAPPPVWRPPPPRPGVAPQSGSAMRVVLVVAVGAAAAWTIWMLRG